MSEWQESDLRPPAPKAGVLTKLHHIPNKKTIQHTSNLLGGFVEANM